MSQPQGHSVAGRILQMINSNDTIGNRNRDLQACSAVPRPTAPPRTFPRFYSDEFYRVVMLSFLQTHAYSDKVYNAISSGYTDTVLCDTSCTSLDILWYQSIPRNIYCSDITTLIYKHTKYLDPFMAL